jgi:glutathione S-transferase
MVNRAVPLSPGERALSNGGSSGGGHALTPLPVLWQLSNSIFSEKARWALDYKGVAHRRKNLPPGLHSAILRVRGRGSTVPVLDVGGRKVRDSTAIIAALEELQPDPPLYPEGEAAREGALELEDFFDEHCGHDVRRVGLDQVLESRDVMVQSLLAGSPTMLRFTARVAHPLVKRQVRRRYRINPESVLASRKKVQAALDRIESELGRGDYLVGERFSVADLAGASLLAPLVLPPELPRVENTPVQRLPELEAFRSSLVERRGFQWVNEMYHRHRGQRAEVGSSDAG